MISKYVLLFISIVINSNHAIVEDVIYVVDNKVMADPNERNLKIDVIDIIEVGFKQELVKIQLYYESLCGDCRIFDSENFADTVKKLGPYLDIHTYPYGNAKTIEYENGTVEIECQHGPAECYGNKLHGCALALLGSRTEALLYNSCMMDRSQAGRGSDDHAADKCGMAMGIDSNPIKNCAKSQNGTTLLYNYGVESKKVGFKYVPYILINGVENDGEDFMADVCKAFKEMPPPCNSVDDTSF